MNTLSLMQSMRRKLTQKTKVLARIGPIQAKTTIPKPMTTKVNVPHLAALVLFLSTCGSYALSMSHLPPREAVGKATDIAVGVVQVSHENGLVVRFQPTQVLKGRLETNKLYTINYADEYNRNGLKQVMERIAAYAEGKPAVLFLGRLHTDGETLVPNSLDGAVWPRHSAYPLHPLLQTPDTLEECITFVKAVMANPEIKLKIVNRRRVLPDDYPLPDSAAATRTETQTTVAQPVTSVLAPPPQQLPPPAPKISKPPPVSVQPTKSSRGFWSLGVFTFIGLLLLGLKWYMK